MAPVLIDRWHGALRLRFDEPARRNPLGLDVVREVQSALTSDPAATVVLGSTDPSVFSAGADLHVDDAVRRQISAALYECFTVMLTRPGLVVAVVEGVTVGGGAQLATAADVRLAGPGSRWRWVGAAHGLAVGSWILPELVGRGRAIELMLSSRWVEAAEAERIGLATAVTGPAWDRAATLVDRIATLDAAAVAALKHVTLHAGLLESLRAERDANRDWDGAVP